MSPLPASRLALAAALCLWLLVPAAPLAAPPAPAMDRWGGLPPGAGQLDLGAPVAVVALGDDLYAIGDEESPFSERGKAVLALPPAERERRKLGLFRSTDDGATWVRLPDPHDRPAPGEVRSLAVWKGRVYFGGPRVQSFDPEASVWRVEKIGAPGDPTPWSVAAGGDDLGLVAWRKKGADAQLIRLQRPGTWQAFTTLEGLSSPTIAAGAARVFTLRGPRAAELELLTASPDAPTFTRVPGVTGARSVVAAPGLALVETPAGLLRSADEGATWGNTSGAPPARLEALVRAGDLWLLMTAQGVYRSHDGGLSWVSSLPGASPPGQHRSLAAAAGHAFTFQGPERLRVPLADLLPPAPEAALPPLRARAEARLAASGWTVAGSMDMNADGLTGKLWQLTRGKQRAAFAWMQGPTPEATRDAARDAAKSVGGLVHQEGTEAVIVAVPGDDGAREALLKQLTAP